MKEIILYAFLAGYFLYSFSYSIEFYKTDKFYSKKIKALHLVLIWIIPFLWILLLKDITKKTLGSHQYKKSRESNGIDTSDGTDVVGDGDSGFHESGSGF